MSLPAVGLHVKTTMLDSSIFPWPVATVLSLFTTIVVDDFVSPFFSSRIYPKYSTLSRKMRSAWNAKVSSTIHALFVCTCVTLITIFEPNDFFTNLSASSSIMKLVYCSFIGYEIADLRHMVVRGGLETPYVFHHIVIIIACFNNLFVNLTLDYYFYLRVLAEYAVPFVNIRWFLRYVMAYPKTSKLYLINGLLVLITYTVFRMGVGPLYHYRVYQGASKFTIPTLLFLFAAGLSMDAVNIWWYWQILKMAKKVLFGKEKEEGVVIREGKQE